MGNDFYIEELFKFNDKWYGTLKINNNPAFSKYVEITHIYPGGYDWLTISSPAIENAVRFFHENKKNR